MTTRNNQMEKLNDDTEKKINENHEVNSHIRRETPNHSFTIYKDNNLLPPSPSFFVFN